MKAMILAAGRGERMRPLTDTVPKPLLRVGGRALIEYSLEGLARAGIREVVINTAWRGRQIRDFLGGGRRYGLNIHYSDESSGRLDTGGGILQALPMLGEGPFLVTNADVFTNFSHGRLVRHAGHMAAAELAHLVLVPNPVYRGEGDFDLNAGRVGNRGVYTFAGIGVYRPELFHGCTPGAFSMVPLLREAVRRGVVGGELHAGEWTDVGKPDRLRELDTRLRS